MKRMKILICDDDELNLKINRVMVEDFLEKRNIKNTEIITRLKIDLEAELRDFDDVDIALLDIDLQDEINGLHIAKAIKNRNPYIVLVFITSFDNYAMDAWKLQSFGFLQKPVNPEEFKQIFQKIILQLNGLRITKMNRMVNLNNKITVKERDIYCVEKISETKDISVSTVKKPYVFRGTIKEMQELLCSSFVRISRNTLINIHYIYRIENGVIEMSNDKVFQVSSNKEKEIKEFYSRIKL